MSEHKEGILAVCGTLLGLTSLSVGLRFYVRKRQRAPIMLDDVCAVACLVSFIGAAAVSIHMVRYRIIGYPNSSEISGEYSAKLLVVWDAVTTTSLAFSKLSALFFFRRIFYLGGCQQRLNIVVLGTAVVVVLWLFVFQFLNGFQCGTHFSALWDGTYVEYCTISFPFLYGLAISDFILDIWILAIPIPSVLRLNASWQKRLAVLGVFLLSLVSVFASGNRVAQFVPLERGGPEYLIHWDYERESSWNNCLEFAGLANSICPSVCALSIVVFYVTMESGLSLLAVNLPTLWFLGTLLKPTMRNLFKKISQSRLISSKKSKDSSDTGDAEAQNQHFGFGGAPPMGSGKSLREINLSPILDHGK